MRTLFYRIAILLLVIDISSTCLAQDTGTKNLSSQVPNSPNEICPILVGESVPELKLIQVDGSSFDVNAAIKKKPTILIFYRGGW